MISAAEWAILTGPRVEDAWVDLLRIVDTVSLRPNMLSAEDSGFEGGTTGSWTAGGSAPPSLSVSTDLAHSGTNSMLVTWDDGGEFPLVGVTVATVPGRSYEARLQAWTPAGSPPVALFIADVEVGSNNVGTEDEWAEISVTWTAEAATSTVQVWPDVSPTSGDKVYIDTGSIRERVLGRATERVGRLAGVTSCRVEVNQHATIRGGCSLTLDDLGQDLDWPRVMVQPWLRVNNLAPWPLGMYLPASPREANSDAGRAWDVPCLDKTSILDGHAITEARSLPVGANPVDAALGVILETGIPADEVAVTPTAEVTRTAMAWPAGTTALRIVNDLMESVNYFAVWADRYGQLRLAPYVRPQDRGLAAEFAAGDAAIHTADWTREQDIAGTPNRVVLLTQGTDEEPGLVAVAENTDPESPYSFQARGRWVSRVYESVEASSQEVLDGLARRWLADASNPSAVLAVEHAPVPLDMADVVRFVDAGRESYAVVEKWGLDVIAGSDMTGSWREITGG